MAREDSNSERIQQLEDLIIRYNKRPDGKIKKKDIVRVFQDVDVLVAVRTSLERADVYEESIEGVSITPDVVSGRNNKKERLLPVFTSYDQIPLEYLETFSIIKMRSSNAYAFMNGIDALDGIVINPFTEINLELRKKKSSKAPKAEKSDKPYVSPAATPAPKEKVKETPKETPKAEDDNRVMFVYNDRKYIIKKTPFVIGRENANITVSENYISKIHAVVSEKEGKFRIADYDSTNGTKLNGKQLKPKVYYEIKDGDEILLAEKEKFIFYRH